MRGAGFLVAGSLALTACLPPASGGSGSPTPEPVLTIMAASSLTDAFTEIGQDFEFLNEGVRLSFVFDSSDELASRIQNGTATDLFASAGEPWMDDIEADPGVLDRSDFVENALVIATPSDNPGEISSLEDLAEPGVEVAVASRGVPLGDYTREMLVNAGLLVEILPNFVEPMPQDDATLVSLVESGGVDAAIVYVSDVSEITGHNVETVGIDGSVNITATYPIAVVEGTLHEDLARRFFAYVRGPEGQATLEAWGFEPLFLG
jgi:molybdate transport system substrate-binding protein